MATYYIATNGNDSNPGSITQPWATIDHAIISISGGDTLYFRAGTYNAYIYVTHVIPSGSVGAPTVIAGYPGETVTWQPEAGVVRVITVGQSGPISYVTFRNLIFDGILQSNVFSSGLSMSANCDHIIVEDFELKNIWGSGVDADSSYTTYRRGVIHDTARDPAAGGLAHGFYIKGSNSLFENLELYNNPGWGLQLQYHTSYFNTVRNCTLHHNGGAIVLSSHHTEGNGAGHDNVVHNCIVYSNSGTGISCGGGGDEIARNHVIYNNTVYNNGSIGIRTGLSENCIIKNNISYNNSPNIRNDGGSGNNTIWSNNLQTNPLFTNAAGADFTLTPFSDAIDAGTPNIASGVTITDFIGSAPDIGALEFGEGETSPVNYQVGFTVAAKTAIAASPKIAVTKIFSIPAYTFIDLHSAFNNFPIFDGSSADVDAKTAVTFGTPKKGLHITITL